MANAETDAAARGRASVPAGMTVTPTVTTGRAATARSANANAGDRERRGGSAGNGRRAARNKRRPISSCERARSIESDPWAPAVNILLAQ